MHPAFSVIFLTTLIGAGQGLFLALFTGQSYAAVDFVRVAQPSGFYAAGSAIALAFLGGGLLASFFHLGRPERAWRAASQWRTSWLSREVIVLPAFMAVVFLYGAIHFLGWDPNVLGTANPLQGQLSLFVGIAGTLACFALFVCTAMIYASVRFLEEWHSPLTVVNYTLLGSASGFLLATAHATVYAPSLVALYGTWTVIISLAALLTRSASLVRNSRLLHKSTLQSAIGVRHSNIQQKAQGFMGGSFNTREFFHGSGEAVRKAVKWSFLVLVFPLPLALLWAGMGTGSTMLLTLAFALQYLGLIAERWLFFAQARHPQNLYYQTV
ncbi:MAG: dimethyl sulfoxide reductase anchor subunit [Gammaproteobacteria bacterium]|nr:dimethyl sulfoxide reductase anchor subunit [Gammaproteobacteria bacterium]NIR98581.1 dimethyl sulfoxide reductase anchor subunit [Gammaproteobacteria bacterium]NIT64304.1 dimethyl sulfoxide reductase anchor subunit [Gammaproteobacteria bacterium]NIV21228.1 dimethyl sulfoxide reductase anchor subunit [Gammaproteobacteria bacterium]NIX10932.1 dimethyl sulfoxide reductase anchor subunit [Gammaproteobacteria bacterium]